MIKTILFLKGKRQQIVFKDHLHWYFMSYLLPSAPTHMAFLNIIIPIYESDKVNNFHRKLLNQAFLVQIYC